MENQETIGAVLAARRNFVSWHMPGHKGKAIGQLSFQEDLTELADTDNLQHPETALRAAAEKIAAVHGAKYAYLSVQGSSGMMCAMLHACLKPGDTILAARNAHKTFFNGCIQADIRPVYLSPTVDETWGYAEGITLGQVQQAAAEHPEAKALYVTNPTYEGYWMDLTDIAAFLHEKGMLLLVDEAHGAHVSYIGGLPKTAMQMGADFAVQSYHKTLPAPTQTAILLQNTDKIPVRRVQSAICLIQTTSPSYLLLAGIDRARAYMQQLSEAQIRDYWERVVRLREGLAALEGIRLYPSVDPSRIVFEYTRARADWFYEALREEGMELEGIFGEGVMAISTIMDTKEDMEALLETVKCILKRPVPENCIKNPEQNKKHLAICGKYAIMTIPKAEMSLRDAFYAEQEPCLLKDAVGRIAASFLTPYPPGIPVAGPGERISPEAAAYLAWAEANGIQVLGLENGSIMVLSERRPSL